MSHACALACLAGSVLAVSAAVAAPVVNDLRYIGQHVSPTATFLNGVQIGGLSGIVYDAANNRYLSISDDRSPAARWYDVSVDLSSGALNQGGVTFNSSTNLLRPDGSQFVNLTLDPEGIAIAPNGNVWVSSEGDTSRGFQPFVNEFSPAGQQVSALPIPAKFAVTAPAVSTGVRNNLAFETLTLSPNGRSLFTATENALFQDGPVATVTTSTSCRILRFDTATGQPAQEFVYVADPVAEPPVPANQFATNGLVDMLALDETTFIAIERSFSVGAPGAQGTGNVIKIYEVSLAGASEVSGFDTLPQGFVPATKSLLFNLNDLNIPVDNIEGITFGPVLPNGKQSIVLVSDNNFSSTQFTQFVAFELTIPTPGATGLLALVGLAAARRRR